jgi:hypothetical protein
MSPLPDTHAARAEERLLDFLLASTPFLNVLRGDRRARFLRAFVDAALHSGSSAMHVEEISLPANPRETALALHRASLDLAQRAGVSRVELTEDYNDHGETGAFSNGSIGEAAERCRALLAVFHARSLSEASS